MVTRFTLIATVLAVASLSFVSASPLRSLARVSEQQLVHRLQHLESQIENMLKLQTARELHVVEDEEDANVAKSDVSLSFVPSSGVLGPNSKLNHIPQGVSKGYLYSCFDEADCPDQDAERDYVSIGPASAYVWLRWKRAVLQFNRQNDTLTIQQISTNQLPCATINGCWLGTPFEAISAPTVMRTSTQPLLLNIVDSESYDSFQLLLGGNNTGLAMCGAVCVQAPCFFAFQKA